MTASTVHLYDANQKQIAHTIATDERTDNDPRRSNAADFVVALPVLTLPGAQYLVYLQHQADDPPPR